MKAFFEIQAARGRSEPREEVQAKEAKMDAVDSVGTYGRRLIT